MFLKYFQQSHFKIKGKGRVVTDMSYHLFHYLILQSFFFNDEQVCLQLYKSQ